MIKALIVGWISCGVLAFGITLGYFQGKWPQFAYKHRVEDSVGATFIGLSGPLGLTVSYLLYDYAKYGLRYSTISREDSWKAFHTAYPLLPEKEFDQ